VYVLDFLIWPGHGDFDDAAVSGFNSRVVERVDCTGLDEVCEPATANQKPQSDHGTAVASLAGGLTFGVAKRVRLHSVRVCNLFEGNGCPVTNVVAGLDWIYHNHQDPAVVNVSINYNPDEEPLFPHEWVDLYSFTQSLIDAGVTVVISAGNDAMSACNAPPAHVTEAVVVAASTQFDSQAGFSNFGSCVDLFAPGDDITFASYVSGGGRNTAARQQDG